MGSIENFGQHGSVVRKAEGIQTEIVFIFRKISGQKRVQPYVSIGAEIEDTRTLIRRRQNLIRVIEIDLSIRIIMKRRPQVGVWQDDKRTITAVGKSNGIAIR